MSFIIIIIIIIIIMCYPSTHIYLKPNNLDLFDRLEIIKVKS